MGIVVGVAVEVGNGVRAAGGVKVAVGEGVAVAVGIAVASMLLCFATQGRPELMRLLINNLSIDTVVPEAAGLCSPVTRSVKI